MAVTEEIMRQAGDIENYKNWRYLLSSMTPIGYAYRNGEPRRYYSDGNGRYYYRGVTEAEMHRHK